jgi:hypothetical protein
VCNESAQWLQNAAEEIRLKPGGIASSENFRHDPNWKLVSQSFLKSMPMVNEITEVHAQEMQDRGKKIVHAHAILDDRLVKSSLESLYFCRSL